QNGNRRLFGQRQGRFAFCNCAAQPHTISAHRPRDILELLLAGILEIHIELIADLLIRRFRNADAAGFRDALQSGRNIHTIPEQVLTFDHHVADIDPHPELDPLVGGDISIPAVHPALDIHGTAHRLHDGRELDQDAVTRGFYNPAPMESHGRVDQLAAQLAEALQRAFLVHAGQPRIAGYVGGQDGGKLAGRVHAPSRLVWGDGSAYHRLGWVDRCRRGDPTWQETELIPQLAQLGSLAMSAFAPPLGDSGHRTRVTRAPRFIT